MRLIATFIIGMLSAVGLNSVSHAASQTLVGTVYESYSDGVECPNTSLCTVSFLPLPAGKTYLIQRVRCRTMAASPSVIMRFGPTTVAGSISLLKPNYFELISNTFASNTYYSTHEAIPQMIIGAGRYPTVQFQTAVTVSNIIMECSLAATTL